MNKTTFEEYKSAIKAEYEAKKTDGIYGSGNLSNLTPAQLRDLCLRISEMGLAKTDESTFRFFFSAKEDEKLGRAIDNFGTGKLKSVISFLKGEKNTEHPTRIELAAIIVDFSPRPYKRYSQIGDNKEIGEGVFQTKKQNIIVSDNDDLEEFDGKKVIIKGNSKTIKKATVFLVALLSLFFMGYTLKGIILPTKECMRWNENHYEAVDCNNEKLGIAQWNLIIPLDESIMKLEKLESKKELVFFKNDKPVVWYSKEDGKIELFNQPGFHPETEKPLKPITNYIIHKYGLKCKE
jgi:hypothetical protein